MSHLWNQDLTLMGLDGGSGQSDFCGGDMSDNRGGVDSVSQLFQQLTTSDSEEKAYAMQLSPPASLSTLPWETCSRISVEETCDQDDSNFFYTIMRQRPPSLI